MLSPVKVLPFELQKQDGRGVFLELPALHRLSLHIRVVTLLLVAVQAT